MRLEHETIVSLLLMICFVAIVALVVLFLSSFSEGLSSTGEAVYIKQISFVEKDSLDTKEGFIYKAQPKWIEVSPIVLESSKELINNN